LQSHRFSSHCFLQSKYPFSAEPLLSLLEPSPTGRGGHRACIGDVIAVEVECLGGGVVAQVVSGNAGQARAVADKSRGGYCAAIVDGQTID